MPSFGPLGLQGQVSFPARVEQAGQDGQGREETSRGQASRAPAEGCGASRFLHGALRAHSSHVQPGARTSRCTQRCPAPSHPPGTTATLGPQQPLLSTGTSPQLRKPGRSPAATPHAQTTGSPTKAPLRAGPDTNSHRLCLENRPACHGAPRDRPVPARPAAWPSRSHQGPSGFPPQPAGCCGTSPVPSRTQRN